MLGGDAATADQLQLVYEDALPAVTALHAGPGSTLRVHRMGDVEVIDAMSVNAEDAGAGPGGPLWDVLDAQGRLLGTIALPARRRIQRITEDAVHGVRADTLDIQRAERLRLIRGGERS